ncbi:MAG: DUF721 domain-containing protein [Porphyromonadaceae bacterium]|nr:DUF721 domain-containing protein [Porphyromonadaceae bacterium]
MQRKEVKRLGEILPQILIDQHLRPRLDEVQAAALWKEIFGDTVTRYTTRVYVRTGVMYVSLSSAVLRNELLSCKTLLLQRLNERMGQPGMIKEIVFR